MSRSTITIYHDYPIINGYIQIPPNNETDKSRVTATTALSTINGSARTWLTGGSGPNRGSKIGSQSFIRLPGLTPGASYATNPVDDLA